MFRPIKDLLTYLQKNTSGSSIFGSSNSSSSGSGSGTTATTESKRGEGAVQRKAHKEGAAPKEPRTTIVPTPVGGVGQGGAAETKVVTMNGKETAATVLNPGLSCASSEPKSNPKSNPNTNPNVNANNNNSQNGVSISTISGCYTPDDQDDIELQIKSSILLRTQRPAQPVVEVPPPQPIKGVSTTTAVGQVQRTTDGGGSSSCVEEPLASRMTTMTTTTEERIETSFAATAATTTVGAAATTTTQILIEDFYSIGSTEHIFAEGTPEEFFTEEEADNDDDDYDGSRSGNGNGNDNDEEPYVKLPARLGADGELNASLASVDPLALDDYTAGALLLEKAVADEVVVVVAEEEDVISLDSSGNDELSRGLEQNPLSWLASAADRTKADTGATHVSTSNHSSTPKPRDKREESGSGIDLDLGRTGGAAGAPEHAAIEEVPSDGSDSGLGSETSALQSTLTDTSQLDGAVQTPAATSTQPAQPDKAQRAVSGTVSEVVTVPMPQLRSNLKRRLEVDEEDALRGSNGSGLNAPPLVDSSSNSGPTLHHQSHQQQQKKPKRSINFDGVQVFYFQRQQGFGCVPSAGGCTLGMSARHASMRTMTLAEHAAELRRAHRMQLQQEVSQRGSSSDDSEESEEDYLSEGSGSDLDAESNGFLQPVSPKQRRAILKAAGVRKIDAAEKAECRDIRDSREVCGCTCRDFCDPDTCACSQAGIKCQVDRAMFPCGCSRDACGNIIGRVEFNPARVRTHFIHTIMRLDMENRQQQHPTGGSAGSLALGLGLGLGYDSAGSGVGGIVSAASASGQRSEAAAVAAVNGHSSGVGATGGGYYGLQPQSAYSSGYASPAYTHELPHYYQPLAAAGQHYAADGAALHQAVPAYPLDSLDAGLFVGGGANATPSYGPLMPAYSSVTATTSASTAAAASASMYHHNMGYEYASGQAQVAASYTPYPHQQHHQQQHNHHHIATGYLPQGHHAGLIPDPRNSISSGAYPSCAVPSLPPYGAATTIVATEQYHCTSLSLSATTNSSSSSTATSLVNSGGVALEISASSSITLRDDTDGGCGAGGSSGGNGGGGSFIDLNTPIASSSRLSQINDLLQHNRNTTAALVAVTSEHPPAQHPPQLHHQMSSINTPPIEEGGSLHKSCMSFEQLSSPLHPSPIVAVLRDNDPAVPIAGGCDGVRPDAPVTTANHSGSSAPLELPPTKAPPTPLTPPAASSPAAAAAPTPPVHAAATDRARTQQPTLTSYTTTASN